MIARSRTLSAKSQGAKRVYVPARSSRTEGDFPLMRYKASPSIMDVEEIEDSPSSQIPSIRLKPHLLSGSDARYTSRKHAPESPIGKNESHPPLDSGIPELKTFDTDTLSSSLKPKKIRWLPNPFLPNNDLRQGGPLYYGKYFTDRDRLMDEKVVQEGIASLKNNQEDTKCDKKRGRRSRAFWREYRPVSIDSIQSISCLDKLSRILANEIHVYNKSESKARSMTIEAIQSRFKDLISIISQPVTKGDLLSMVKCMHQFGVYGSAPDPHSLNLIMDHLSSNDSRKILKPVNYIYLMQSMSRLNFRDHRLLKMVDFLALCWTIVGIKEPLMLIRGANAIAKLDLVSPYTKNLKDAMSELLPKLTVSQLEKIKAITIVQLFDELMILDYFVTCSERKIGYKRHMILVYLHFQKNKSVMNKVPSHVKEWVEECVREACTQSAVSESYSSPLHKDIHSILATQFSNHQVLNSQQCGPITLDIFLPSLNVAVEACSEFQFYSKTSKLTAEAKFRHELIRSLGMKLVPIFHFNWTLLDDKSRINKLKLDLGI
jgi:hypothetical protein